MKKTIKACKGLLLSAGRLTHRSFFKAGEARANGGEFGGENKGGTAGVAPISFLPTLFLCVAAGQPFRTRYWRRERRGDGGDGFFKPAAGKGCDIREKGCVPRAALP